MEEFIWNVDYWSKELERVSDEIHPIRSKLCEAPIPDLTYEERFKLRETLMQYYSISHLLRETLDKRPTPPVPFYRRIFRKK